MNKSWFYGKLGRVETESLLLSANANCYLVRDSSVPGSYALSVYTKEKNAFTHFLISYDQTGFCLKDSLDLNTYKTLELLLSTSCETVGHVPLGVALQKPVTLNPDWFCGNMSRQEAEQVLAGAT